MKRFEPKFKANDKISIEAHCNWYGHVFNITIKGTIDKVILPIDEYEDPQYWVWVTLPDGQKVRERFYEGKLR
jgi:hypothetical protein